MDSNWGACMFMKFVLYFRCVTLVMAFWGFCKLQPSKGYTSNFYVTAFSSILNFFLFVTLLWHININTAVKNPNLWVKYCLFVLTAGIRCFPLHNWILLKTCLPAVCQAVLALYVFCINLQEPQIKVGVIFEQFVVIFTKKNFFASCYTPWLKNVSMTPPPSTL